jgi:rhamnogalacturonyl hydrolase YesR
VDKPEIWVDSFYMAPPFLAVAGHHHQAVLQVEGYRRKLWNADAKLFAHIWDDGAKSFKREAHWGVGNGWAIAGMIRVIAELPIDLQSDKLRISGYVKEAIDGCLAHMRADGLFHDVIDDAGTFVETNAAQMISYSIYRAVSLGVLDATYVPHADKMRNAARLKVDEHGFVQGVCAAPFFDRPGTAPEGQAFYLLMESASSRLRAAMT